MDLIKLKKQLQVEVDTAFLYDSIASIQTDDSLKRVLNSLADIEKGHAKHMLEKVLPLLVVYPILKNNLLLIQLKTKMNWVKTSQVLSTII